MTASKAPSTPAPASSHTKAAVPSLLANRGFMLLLAAYGVSALGDHLSEMALLKLQNALDPAVTDTTRRQAVMLFVFLAPFFVLGPFCGWVADRLPRKWIMIGADLIRAAVMFELLAILTGVHRWFDPAVANTGGSPVPHAMPLGVAVMPLAFIGVFAAFFSPARLSLLPTLIEPNQLVRANAMTAGLGMIATIASAVLGGYLVDTVGVNWNFRLDAATFLVSAACLIWIVPPRLRGRAKAQAMPGLGFGSAARASRPSTVEGGVPPSSTAEGGCPPSTTAGGGCAPQYRAGPSQHGLASLVDGFAYVRRHRRVAELVLIGAILWTAAAVVRSIIPAIVKDVFGGGYAEVGLYQGLLGVGLVCGSIVLTVLGPALRSEIAMSWSLKLAGIGGLLLTAGVGFGWSRAAVAACIVLIGFFGAGIQVSVFALLQRIVPDRVRGRVFGVNDVVNMCGVLLATGLLGIPDWPNIDRHIAWIMALTSVGLVTAGVWTTWVRMKRGRFGRVITFWRNVSEFHNRLFARVRRDGLCTIPASGPVIVAANHHCSLDPFLLISTSPNRYISFLIAREYAEIPLFARLVRMIECIPVNRTGVDVASIKAALRHLEAGKVLGIFPQGRIQSPDEPPRVIEGVGLLALRSGATVIPAYISGTHHSDSVVVPFIRLHRAVVRYGPPVDLSEWAGRATDRAAVRAAADRIMREIQALKPTG